MPKLLSYQRARGKRATIERVMAPMFAGYSLLAGAVSPWWWNLVAILAIGVSAIIGVLTYDAFHRRRVRDTIVLEAAPGCEELRRVEDARAQRAGAGYWWRDLGGARWFEHVFAFWWKVEGVDAKSVRYRVEPGDLRDRLDEDAPEPTETRRKAALISASGLLTDEEPVLEVATLDWELARWAEEQGLDFFERNSRMTAFGIKGWTPYPGILVVHLVVETLDGWVLAALRRPDAAYHPWTWSVSIEEQVQLGEVHRNGRLDSTNGEATVGQTSLRGLHEELGLAPEEIEVVDMLAIGRECVLSTERRVMSAALLTTARLAISLRELWTRLDDVGRIRDRHEHVAWMALRFHDRTDVDAVLAATGPSEEGGVGPNILTADDRLSIGLSVYPGSDTAVLARGHPWHPTSRVRLYLWGEWAARRARLG